jgi:hypothetical protein
MCCVIFILRLLVWTAVRLPLGGNVKSVVQALLPFSADSNVCSLLRHLNPFVVDFPVTPCLLGR